MSATTTPPAAEEYAARLTRWSGELATEEAGCSRLGWARVVVFGLGVADFFWVTRVVPEAWPTLLVPTLVFAWLVHRHGLAKVRRLRAARAVTLYERASRRLLGLWMDDGAHGESFVDEGHLFAMDLDLLGKGSVFQRLCTARTRMGEETLARWLLEPAAPAETRRRQLAVEELRGALDLREELALVGPDSESDGDAAALRAWIARPGRRVPPGLRLVSMLLGLLGAGAAVAWAFFDAGLVPLVLVGVGQAIVGQVLRGLLSDETRELADLAPELGLLSDVLHVVEAQRFDTPALAELRASLERDGRPPSAHVRRLAFLVATLHDAGRNAFFAPVAFVLGLRVPLIEALESWRREHAEDVTAWLGAVGRLEALCAFATAAYENPQQPFAEIEEDTGPCLIGEGLGHLLLSEERCVRNDIRLDARLRLLLVSGSNMSGKSTLLRTVGVNVVLGLAGATVCAKRLRLSPFDVGASICVHDSLLEGASRFYAEIRRLAAIDAAVRAAADAGKRPVLFLLDEILHGTNSSDRVVGASAVVRALVDRGAVGLVTTHDLALARLADELGERARNVHFEDHLEEGRMVFDYIMRDGVVERGNALPLMRSLGLEV